MKHRSTISELQPFFLLNIKLPELNFGGLPRTQRSFTVIRLTLGQRPSEIGEY